MVSVIEIFLSKHYTIIPRIRSSGLNVFRPETENIWRRAQIPTHKIENSLEFALVVLVDILKQSALEVTRSLGLRL